jgi:hypothetical protein
MWKEKKEKKDIKKEGEMWQNFAMCIGKVCGFWRMHCIVGRDGVLC